MRGLSANAYRISACLQNAIPAATAEKILASRRCWRSRQNQDTRVNSELIVKPMRFSSLRYELGSGRLPRIPFARRLRAFSAREDKQLDVIGESSGPAAGEEAGGVDSENILGAVLFLRFA